MTKITTPRNFKHTAKGFHEYGHTGTRRVAVGFTLAEFGMIRGLAVERQISFAEQVRQLVKMGLKAQVDE